VNDSTNILISQLYGGGAPTL